MLLRPVQGHAHMEHNLIAHQQTLKESKFKNNSSDESLLNVAVCIELRVEQTNRKWARK